jgi:NAD(P)-dependent dehydrogenase (short-subunit alcohol dehydrogenase family)
MVMTATIGRHSQTRAVVTGGAQGIGFAVAEALADEGCTAVALVGRDAAKGERAVAGLTAKGVHAVFIGADIARVADCERAVATAVGELGGVNALVNAAATSARGSLTETDEALFDHVFATNARGPFFLMQGVVRHLLERGAAGSIVNVLSVNVHCGQPFLAAYSASKGALATLTKNAANAYRGNRIRCNAVLPGWMDTEGEDMVQKTWHGADDGWLAKAEAAQPMGQLVKPRELARLVTYMLSPEAGVMTGALVDFDQNVSGIFGG